MKFNIRIFVAELVGTFGLLVAATGSIVYDGFNSQTLGLEFIALMHLLGLWILVSVFGHRFCHNTPCQMVRCANIPGGSRYWKHTGQCLCSVYIGISCRFGTESAGLLFGLGDLL